MVRRSLIFLLTVAAGADAGAVTDAQVFKWVDAEGRAQFSDRPQANAEAVGIRTGTGNTAAAPSSSLGDEGMAGMLGPYAGFEIVSPASDETLRQKQDTLPVSLLLDPPLFGGHQLQFVLDGSIIPVDKSAGTQLSLGGVTFGSHQAYAQILGSRGAVVARTPVVIFHIRKPIPPGVLP